MGQSKDISLRQKVVMDQKQGSSYIQIAERYGINYNTVRTICLRYKESGDMGLIPRYSNCGRPVVSGSERTFRLVRLLKYLHPSWGVGYILARLKLAYPDLVFQSERHYQRRLANGIKGLPKAQLPAPAPTDRSRLAHDTWQIDAKEYIHAADGQTYCFLNVTDEKTAALLKVKGFPPGADLSGSPE